MRSLYLIVTLGVLLSMFTLGCRRHATAYTSTEVWPDTTMVARLFPQRPHVLTGGDGAISIAIDSTKSYFLWGDSFLGEVTHNQRPDDTPLVMGNIFQLLDGDSVVTLYKGTSAQPRSLYEQADVDGHPAILWPMHGFYQDSIIHLFFSVIVKTGEGTFDFYWDGTLYYRLRYPALTVIDSTRLDDGLKNGVHYGFGNLEAGGYHYVYGTRPNDQWGAPVHVARARMAGHRLQAWEYFDGTAWTTDPAQTQPVAGVDIPVSEQFSVFEHQGRYVLLAQDRFQGKIYTYLANAPQGPWQHKQLVYTIPEAANERVFVYNAMAHPQYNKEGCLLVSYCVNAKHIPDLYSDVSIYRPRFIRVPYALIEAEE